MNTRKRDLIRKLKKKGFLSKEDKKELRKAGFMLEEDLPRPQHEVPQFKEAGLYDWSAETQEKWDQAVNSCRCHADNIIEIESEMQLDPQTGLVFFMNNPEYGEVFDKIMEEALPLEELKQEKSQEDKIYSVVEVLLSIRPDILSSIQRHTQPKLWKRAVLDAFRPQD